MIAVVTSTIKPFDTQGKSLYSFAERLNQTKATLSALQNNGFTSIFLADNSPELDVGQLNTLLGDFPEIKLFHFQQYQFMNKGISELLLSLSLIRYLPADEEIFKISGRYCTGSPFLKPAFKDMGVKGYHFKDKTGTISTRAYWVKSAVVWEAFLLKCLTEVFAYPERISGARSLLKNLSRLLFNSKYQPLNISIEFAAANVLKAGCCTFTFLDHLGIEGLVAGAGQVEKITE